jgi:beta-N-acetylhexosaminidase
MKAGRVDPEVRRLLGEMTPEQKVGQMFLLAFAGPDPARAERMIREHFIGGCYISQENADTPRAACALSSRLQEYAASSGAGIPLLVGADQEGAWGVIMPESTTGPGNLGLGAANSARVTSKMYRVIGEELRAVGYNTLFAPCVDVNSNPRNSIIGMRSFGENPSNVGRLAKAAVRGARAGGVITTAKHFPGHGDTSLDSHRNIPRVERSRAEVEKIDLLPFRIAIRAGVDIVMTSHILYPCFDPGNPATLSPAILGELLRSRMGFQGVILSDSMNMGAMRRNFAPAEAAVHAVQAGVDMIMLAEEHYDHDQARYEANQLAGVNGVLEAVRSGSIPQTVIDGAVSRILHLKKAHGLLGGPRAPLDANVVGSVAHRGVERAAAERLVVQVRNRAGVWPVARAARVAVVQTAPKGAFAILTATRGIGPNQAEPASASFIRTFSRERPDAAVYSNESMRVGGSAETLPEKHDVVIAITEDYPLPGVDFDTPGQIQLVKRLLAILGTKLIVIALRPPYELPEYPALATYICTCSSRPCAAEAAARAACGIIGTRGKLPVSVPDAR